MKTCLPPTVAIVAWAILLFSPFKQANAQVTTVEPYIAAQLQSQLDGFITQFNLKGLSASVIIPGKGTWSGVSGISHENEPIDPSMVFAIGSITKNLTAAAILFLQQEGLLHITDPLHKFLPTYPNIDPDITIKQLLQHTSGIFNYMDHAEYWKTVGGNPWHALSQEYLLKNFVSAPKFTPGTKHEYSNTNYVLLGQIIEKVSGQSYAIFLREWFLDPLQLTSFYVAEHEQPTGVKPHNWMAQGPSDPGIDVSADPMTSIWGTSASDGALIGNAYDLARWGQLLFSGKVLHDSSLEMMKQFVPINVGPLTGYGLGLARTGSGNMQTWGHNGGIRGWTANLTFSPFDSIVVAVQSNKDASPGAFALMLLNTARKNMLGSPSEASGLRLRLSSQPNPFSQQVRVKLAIPKEALGGPLTVEVFDVLGVSRGKIFDGAVSSNSLELDWHPLTSDAGTYYVVARTAEVTVTQKIVYRW